MGGSKSSLRASNSAQGLKTLAEGGCKIYPTPNKRSPSSSDIEFKRKLSTDGLQNHQIRTKDTSTLIQASDNSPTSNNAEGANKTAVPSKATPSAPSKKGKKEVTCRIANLWKKV